MSWQKIRVMMYLHGIISLSLCCGILIGVTEFIQWLFPVKQERLFSILGFVNVTREDASIFYELASMIGVIVGGIIGGLYLYIAYRIICWKEDI